MKSSYSSPYQGAQSYSNYNYSSNGGGSSSINSNSKQSTSTTTAALRMNDLMGDNDTKKQQQSQSSINNKYSNNIDNILINRLSSVNQSNKRVVNTVTDRNTLKSDQFPMISSNWENTKYSDYIGFRAYYVYLKSTGYIAFNLLFLSICFVVQFFLYYYFDQINQYDNIFLYYYLPLGCVTGLIGYLLNNIYLHFKQVPEIKLTEDERVLYDWPNNFPTSPLSHLSPVKPTTTPTSSTISPTTPRQQQQLNIQDLTLSPINNNNNSQQKDTYVSSFSSYSQFVKANQTISSPSLNNNNSNSISFSSSSQHQHQNHNKSFEELERDRINYNFKGRLYSNLTDFSFEDDGNGGFKKQSPVKNDSGNESIDGQDGGEYYQREPLKEKIALMSDLNNNEPIQYNIVQKPTTIIDNNGGNIVTKKTFQQTVEHKVLIWDRFIEDNHLYSILECATKCRRWFSINILSQLVEPAKLFLSLKEEVQLQQIQEEQSKQFSKIPIEQMPGGSLDVIKSVLKNVMYNLNSLNDVHHKKECVYICHRIIELSADKHVFLEFNKQGGIAANASFGSIGNANELPTDEQLLFCLFLAYMDYKLYRDITAPNPDIPFTSKYIKYNDVDSKINAYSSMISIAYKRPLHCDLLIPNGYSHQICDISPGFDNLFFTITLFFYNVIQNQNGYLENFNVDFLNVGSFVQPLLSSQSNSRDNSDDDEFFY